VFNIFKKKEKLNTKDIKNSKENIENKINVQTEEKSFVAQEEVFISKPIRNREEEYITTQCIEMGMDIKNCVETSAKAFFQSRNKEKAIAYNHLYHYLLSLEKYHKDSLKNMDYLEFKEKEEQIYTRLKTGFSQFLSKGSPLDEKMRRNTDLVFSDIKKLPSKGHRYWYYKIYIWQEAKNID